MRRLMLIALAIGLLTACGGSQELPTEELFPASVGDYFRIAGPFTDPETEAEYATYSGPDGEVTLFVRFVGEANVPYSLSELPSGALDVGYDDVLGPREGVVFTYALGSHAAWGNGDWVFILNTPTVEARRRFLAGYGF